MKLTRSIQPNWGLFSLLPVVNVVFLVAIFFNLSTRFVIQPGVAVMMPSSPFRLSPSRNPQVVSIVSAPEPSIYFKEERVPLSDLGQRLKVFADRQQTIVVRADRSVPFALVSSVMNEALQLGFPVVLAGSEAAP